MKDHYKRYQIPSERMLDQYALITTTSDQDEDDDIEIETEAGCHRTVHKMVDFKYCWEESPAQCVCELSKFTSVVVIVNKQGNYVSCTQRCIMLPAIEARDDLPSACEEVARLRLRWSDHSLSELVENKVLERDEGDNVVRKGEQFTEVWNDMW